MNLNRLTRCAAGAAAALAVVIPIITTSAAQAMPTLIVHHWSTIETFDGGKQLACKVSTNAGRTWTIYNRLDAHLVKAATGSLEATLTVHNANTTRLWDSKYVSPGHYSAVGSVVLPRSAGYGLVMTIHGRNSGTGGVPKVANIVYC